MSLTSNNQNLMFQEKILDLSIEEANILYKLNSTQNILKNIYFRNSDDNGSKKRRAREKERDIIDKLDTIIYKNEISLFTICRANSIVRVLTPFLKKEVETLKVNNLMLYDLRLNVLSHLMNKETSEKDMLENILNKVQKTLTWNTLSEIDDFYHLIEINFYRKISIGEVMSPTVHIN